MASVVIVGGGVIGCAIAERLVRQGHRVTLLERDRIGSHASGGAAGMLAPFSEPEFADPGDDFARQARRGFELFPELVSRVESDTGIDVEYSPRQTLRLAPSKIVAEGFQARARSRWLDWKECRKLEPALADEGWGGLLYEEAQVSPRRLVSALARAAAAAGAEIREGAQVTGLIARGDRVEGVRFGAERVSGDWVVLAAGPWTAQVAAGIGLEVDVAPRRGQLVTLAPGGPVLRRILAWDSLYLVPKLDGTVVVGGTEEVTGFDPRPTVAAVARLFEFAQRAVPVLGEAEVVWAWAGLRPMTSTGLPLVGPAPGFRHLVLATGHRRNGVLLAPATAEAIGGII